MFHPTIIERIIEEFPQKAIKHQLAFACTHCNCTGLDPETRQTCKDCNGMGVCEWRANGMSEWLRPMIENLYQEARREALKEMDEAHVASEKAYQAFRMNGRCEPWSSEGVKAQDVVIKLRQEYES